MNKNVKNILIIGGVALVGYWLWKNYGKKTSMPTSKTSDNKESNFSYASGRLTSRVRSGGEDTPPCPSCSSMGECYTIVPRTDVTIASGIAGQRAIQSCTPTRTMVASRR